MTKRKQYTGPEVRMDFLGVLLSSQRTSNYINVAADDLPELIRRLQAFVPNKCMQCSGTGQCEYAVIGWRQCAECNGTGVFKPKRKRSKK